MIKQALFPQTVEIEDEDPIYEINPCVTKSISDYPKDIQDRLKGSKGSGITTQKRFSIKNKVVES